MYRFALLFALMLVAPVGASAQSTPEGPGPFSAIAFKPKALVFDVDRAAAGASVFNGSVRIEVDADGSQLAFETSPQIKKAGARLKQTGTAGGRTIASLFPDGGRRRLTLRNGDGGVTELEVERRGGALAVISIDRSPGGGGGGGTGPAVVLTGSAQVSGSADSSTDVVLTPGAVPSGLDVTINATLPAPPAGATSFTAAILALTAGGQTASRSADVAVTGGSATLRLDLPAGSYRLLVEYTAVIGSLETSQLTATRRVDLNRSIAVSASAREFAVDLPAMPLPSLQQSTVSVSNAAQFAPPAGGGNAALVALVTAAQDGSESYAVAAVRELDASGAVSIAVSAPAGTYQGAVSVLPSAVATGGSVAASYHVASIIVQNAPLPGTIGAAFPATSRVPAALRDPANLLPARDPARPETVTHLVALTGILGGGSLIMTSTAVVLDASQEFTLYYPTGAIGTVIPVLDLSNAAPDGRALENVTLTYNPGLFFAAAPARIDVQVPSIGRMVTVAGRTIDGSSRPLAGAAAAAFTATVEGLAGGAITGLYVTESDGRFRFELPAASSYTISATYVPAR